MRFHATVQFVLPALKLLLQSRCQRQYDVLTPGMGDDLHGDGEAFIIYGNRNDGGGIAGQIERDCIVEALVVASADCGSSVVNGGTEDGIVVTDELEQIGAKLVPGVEQLNNVLTAGPRHSSPALVEIPGASYQVEWTVFHDLDAGAGQSLP